MKTTNRYLTASIVSTAMLLGATTNAFAVTATTEGFDGGTDGGFTGNAFYEANGGNPDGNAHFQVTAFGLSLRTGGPGNLSNPGFLGDYSSFGQVRFSFDVQVDSITNFFGGEIPAAIGISLIIMTSRDQVVRPAYFSKLVLSRRPPILAGRLSPLLLTIQHPLAFQPDGLDLATKTPIPSSRFCPLARRLLPFWPVSMNFRSRPLFPVFSLPTAIMTFG